MTYKQPSLLLANDPGEPSDRIATITREYNHQKVETRIDRTSFNNSPRFTKLHVWEHGPNGCFPTKRVITIRDRELLSIIEALQKSHAMAVEERRAAGDKDNPEDLGAQQPDWLKRHNQRDGRRQWRGQREDGGGEP